MKSGNRAGEEIAGNQTHENTNPLTIRSRPNDDRLQHRSKQSATLDRYGDGCSTRGVHRNRYYLTEHPDKRPIFEAAKQALDGLVDTKNSDPLAFQKALAGLPIKELRGDKGAIVVNAAVILWDAYAAKWTKLDKSQNVLPVVIAVRDGIARALP